MSSEISKRTRIIASIEEFCFRSSEQRHFLVHWEETRHYETERFKNTVTYYIHSIEQSVLINKIWFLKVRTRILGWVLRSFKARNYLIRFLLTSYSFCKKIRQISRLRWYKPLWMHLNVANLSSLISFEREISATNDTLGKSGSPL